MLSPADEIKREEYLRQREIKKERVESIIKTTINDVTDKYEGEMASRQLVDTMCYDIKASVECLIASCFEEEGGLDAVLAMYPNLSVFSISVDRYYVIDVIINSDGIKTDVIEKTW